MVLDWVDPVWCSKERRVLPFTELYSKLTGVYWVWFCPRFVIVCAVSVPVYHACTDSSVEEADFSAAQ